MTPQWTEFSFDDALTFKRELLAAIAAGGRVVDLAGVSGGDSSLLSVLLAGRRIAPDLQILNLSPALAQLAQLYGVADLLGLPKSASEPEVN